MKGNTLISAMLLALALVMFVPAFDEAAAGFSGEGWAYAPYVVLVLEHMPILLIAAAALVLVMPLNRGGV